MWLFYEQPEIDFRDGSKFMDIRNRAFRFPSLFGKKGKYTGIPTTSGTGSEVTHLPLSFW